MLQRRSCGTTAAWAALAPLRSSLLFLFLRCLVCGEGLRQVPVDPVKFEVITLELQTIVDDANYCETFVASVPATQWIAGYLLRKRLRAIAARRLIASASRKSVQLFPKDFRDFCSDLRVMCDHRLNDDAHALHTAFSVLEEDDYCENFKARTGRGGLPDFRYKRLEARAKRMLLDDFHFSKAKVSEAFAALNRICRTSLRERLLTLGAIAEEDDSSGDDDSFGWKAGAHRYEVRGFEMSDDPHYDEAYVGYTGALYEVGDDGDVFVNAEETDSESEAEEGSDSSDEDEDDENIGYMFEEESSEEEGGESPVEEKGDAGDTPIEETGDGGDAP